MRKKIKNPRQLPVIDAWPSTIGPGEIAVVYGANGTGKTTLAQRLIHPDRSAIVVDPAGTFNGKTETVALFSTMLELLNKYDVFLIDDADVFFSSFERSLFQLKQYLILARHKKKSFVVVARRPSSIPRTLTAVVNRTYVFRIREPRDVKEIDRVFQGAGELLPLLPLFGFIEISDPGLKIFKPNLENSLAIKK